MTIDDPIRALQQQFENEERSSDPLVSRVAKLFSTISSLPVGPVVQAFAGISAEFLGHVQADRLEKMDLLIATISEEFRRLEKRVEVTEQSSSETRARFEKWLPLVVDGLKRAEGEFCSAFHFGGGEYRPAL
jgi:hypothetical protein